MLFELPEVLIPGNDALDVKQGQLIPGGNLERGHLELLCWKKTYFEINSAFNRKWKTVAKQNDMLDVEQMFSWYRS